jgi:peptidoglycan/LPS O-acetylase OafA/YrhL
MTEAADQHTFFGEIHRLRGLAILFVVGAHAFDANTLNHLTRWEKIGYMLLNGGSTLNYALWFIPVIWIYFLASPLLIRIDRQPYRYGILLLFRPVYTGGHNLVLALYFLSAFVLGMACSRFRHHTLRLIDAHLLPIVTVTAVIFFGHLFLSNHHGKYTTDNAWIDWMFLQKTCMTVTLLGLLRRFQIVAMPILDRLGDASFTIYFYHLYVIFTVSWLTHNASIEIDSLRLLPLTSASPD